MARSRSRGRPIGEAVRDIASHPDARFIAGGTNILDLMKENVARPARLIDITRLPLKAIEPTADGGLRLGALRDQRRHRLSRRSASGAIRSSPKRSSPAPRRRFATWRPTAAISFSARAAGTSTTPPRRATSASRARAAARVDGVNRMHAILGQSDSCIAVHPSDFCVALAALEAIVQVRGPSGDRAIPFAEFHRLPGDTPHVDNTLRAGRDHHRDRSSAAGVRGASTRISRFATARRIAFALVSVAVGLEMDGTTIRTARIALGGVAHKPWRVPDAEALLEGQHASEENFRRVADAYLAGARGYAHNTFKIELAKRAIVRALVQAVNMESDGDRQLHRTTTEPR